MRWRRRMLRRQRKSPWATATAKSILGPKRFWRVVQQAILQAIMNQPDRGLKSSYERAQRSFQRELSRRGIAETDETRDAFVSHARALGLASSAERAKRSMRGGR